MLVLIAHGSHDPNWRASVEELVGALQTDLGRDSVRVAYMECTPPTLTEVVSDAVRAGAERVRVLPLFLAEEGHVRRNVCPLVNRVREVHPAVRLELLPPIGKHPLFRELIYKIATRTDGRNSQ